MGLLGNANNGGLNATNRPNPFGLRAFELPNGNYGGEMMPKGTGFHGLIEGVNGNNITEYSMGGVNGQPFFPSVTENLYEGQINDIKQLEPLLITVGIEEEDQDIQWIIRHSDGTAEWTSGSVGTRPKLKKFGWYDIELYLNGNTYLFKNKFKII